jgi:nitroreductase
MRMDVFKAIKGRRSVRAFTDEPVSEEEIMKIIDAARWAPSAGNIQPWEFIVVQDAKTKRGLVETALDQTFIQEAPVVIVVCANPKRSSRRYGSRGASLYCLQDTAAAIQNINLAAYALGLATCWVGAFEEEKARRVLNLPDNLRPVAIIPVGQPAEKPTLSPRRPLSEVVHREVFERK